MSLDIEKVASLAYLKLREDQKPVFTENFEKILHYVDQLKAVPMSAEDAKAMGQFHILSAFYKEMGWNFADSIRADDSAAQEGISDLNLANHEALANAPSSSGLPEGLMFEVPSIIERPSA